MLDAKSTDTATASWLGWFAASWGVLGFALLLGNALLRLSPMAWVALTEYTLSALQWVLLIAWCLFMLISEGYKGFQKAFSPRFAARARWLRDHPRFWPALLAPLFCMGFFGATRKRKIVIWCLTLAIVVMVILIRLLPQPWRGIIDAGVVLGLSWGLFASLIFSFQALFSERVSADPEISEALLTSS